jgi:hypothetical protein
MPFLYLEVIPYVLTESPTYTFITGAVEGFGSSKMAPSPKAMWQSRIYMDLCRYAVRNTRQPAYLEEASQHNSLQIIQSPCKDEAVISQRIGARNQECGLRPSSKLIICQQWNVKQLLFWIIGTE